MKKYNKFADQDVLNIIFKDKIKFIDKKFNTLIDIQKINTSKNKELQDGMAVLHFAGYLKPWNCANKEIIKIYYSYMAKTPWIKNNDDLITVISDISVQYDKKMDLKNCLYCKPKCGMNDNFLLFIKAVLSKDSCFKFSY